MHGVQGRVLATCGLAGIAMAGVTLADNNWTSSGHDIQNTRNQANRRMVNLAIPVCFVMRISLLSDFIIKTDSAAREDEFSQNGCFEVRRNKLLQFK